MEPVDKRKRLPTGKTIARGNPGFHCTSVRLSAVEIIIDKQHKAVGQDTEIKASHG